MPSDYTTTGRIVWVVAPPPPGVMQHMIDRAVAQAETEASKALGLDFSFYTNAELDTVETAARAERRMD